MKNFWVLTTIFIIIISFIIVQTRVQAGPAKQTALGNWEIVSSPATSHLWGVNIVSEDDIYAVGGLYFFDQDPIVLHCNGTDWQVDSTFSSDNQGLMDVSFFDTDNGLAAGYQTLSHYNSTNWNHEYESATFLSGVDMFGPNSGIAVGSYYDLSSYNWPKYGSIQMYSGGSWQETGTRSDEGYIDVDMLDAAEGWIVGADTATENVNGIVLHRSSTVPNWTTVHTTSEGLNGVAAVSSNDVWTVGANGTIVHYTGGVWQSVTSPVSTNLRRIAMLSATEGWIVGAGGTILHYENGTWQTVASPVITDWSLAKMT